MLRKIGKVLYRSLECKEISYKKIKEMMQKDVNAILLDVRSKQEFEEGHLEGSINMPLYEIEKKMEELPNKNCTMILYCASGHRSKQAKEKLERIGYKNIYQLKNGLDGM